MRFGGFLMIWGGCLGTGIWYCCRYLRGIRTMMHLEVLLLLMEERMRYGRNSMTVVLQELCDKSQGDMKKFWQSMIEPDLSGEESFACKWRRQAHQYMKAACLKGEVLEEFAELGSYLGNQNLNQQLLSLEQYRNRLHAALLEQQKLKPKYIKLYPVMGGCLGMILCMLMAG
ncbi:MAG: stage III sporulation protein AB [Eubacterium sp.]|nr:stage III sporulation protein AB [Eubacterium sp.]